MIGWVSADGGPRWTLRFAMLINRAAMPNLDMGRRSLGINKMRNDDYDASATQITQKRTAIRPWVAYRTALMAELTQ